MKNIQKKLEAKYKSELATFEKAKDFDEKWLSILSDLASATESIGDYNAIRYDTVMTKAEWENFVNHPERKPYTSNLMPNFDYEKLVDVLTDAIAYYKSLKPSDAKTKLKSTISSLLDGAIYTRYDTEFLRFSDTYVGRSDADRDNGIVDPTEVSKATLEFLLTEYAHIHKCNFEELKTKIYQICDGRLAVLVDYYSMCDMDIETRKLIKELLDMRKRDLTLAFTNIRVGWEIWKSIHNMGLDVESYLELIDLPNYKVVEKKMLSFLNNKDFAKEVLLHLKDELPLCYKKYTKQGYIDSVDLTHEEAQRKQYPTKLQSKEEIEKMISECKLEIYKYFPLAKNQTPRNILMNPTHPQATSRAFQSSTKNAQENRVNVIVMTPRVLPKDEYLPVLAHETAHAMHRYILEKGEKAKVLEKGAVERIPSSVMEDFSQLVEHLFYKDEKLPYQKKFKGKEFPNFLSSRATYTQAPFALVQLGIRKDFDKLWESGYRAVLPDAYVWDLMTKFDKVTKDLLEKGVNIKYGYLPGFRFFNAFNPDDGLVYMKRYIVDHKNAKNTTQPKASAQAKAPVKSLSMAEAFKQRFGNNWVEDKDARTILLWLLLESGRNYKTETFGNFVVTKDPKECFEELSKIGVTKGDI